MTRVCSSPSPRVLPAAPTYHDLAPPPNAGMMGGSFPALPLLPSVSRLTPIGPSNSGVNGAPGTSREKKAHTQRRLIRVYGQTTSRRWRSDTLAIPGTVASLPRSSPTRRSRCAPHAYSYSLRDNLHMHVLGFNRQGGIVASYCAHPICLSFSHDVLTHSSRYRRPGHFDRLHSRRLDWRQAWSQEDDLDRLPLDLYRRSAAGAAPPASTLPICTGS